MRVAIISSKNANGHLKPEIVSPYYYIGLFEVVNTQFKF